MMIVIISLHTNYATNVPCSERARTYLHRRVVDMLHRHRPARALQSANNNDLQVPSTSSRYDDRAFAVSTPRLWNALPRELNIATSLIYFKKLLKTHLFLIAYVQ